MANGVEIGTAYVSVTADVKGLEKGVKDALLGSSKNADTAGRNITASLTRHGGQAGTLFSTEFGKGLQKGLAGVSSNFGPLSSAVENVLSGISTKSAVAVAGVAGIGMAAGTLTKQFYDLGAQWDTVMDGITGKTGLVGKELSGLKDNIKDVARDSTASLGEIGDVAGQLVQTLRLTGKPLENLTKNITDLNELTGDKLNVRDLAKVFHGFGIEADRQTDALNSLYDAFTNTGIPVSELISTLKQVGPTARTLGLDIGQAAGLIATLEEAGVDANSALSGLRIAMGNLSKEKLPPGALANFMKDERGKPLTEVLGDLIGEIQRTGNIDLARSAFGKSWQPIFDVIKNGKLDVDSLNKSLENTGHTIQTSKDATDDLNQSWDKFVNKLKVDLEPAANAVFSSFNNLIDQYVLRPLREAHNLLDFFGNWPKVQQGPSGPSGPGAVPGANPLDVIAGRPGGGAASAGGPTLGGIPIPGVGVSTTTGGGPNNPLTAFSHPGAAQTGGGGQGLPVSARGYAHSVAMPYWQSQGFAVGDHGADQYGEHQNGAVDVMVSSIAAGQPVLQQALSDPNVYGVIFNGQSYGYGHGMTPQPYSGSSPHTDHVHIWYKPQGYTSGGGVDTVPAMLTPGEHVLTTGDVAAMGGQAGVYAFRNSLHMDTGGGVSDPRMPFQTEKDYVKWASEYRQAGIFMLPPGLQGPDWQRNPTAIKSAIPGPSAANLMPGETWADFANAEGVALQKITNPSKRGPGWMEGAVQGFLPRWTLPKKGPGLNPPEIPGADRGRLTNPIRDKYREAKKWNKGDWERRLPADILFGGIGASLGQPAWPHFAEGGAVDPNVLKMMQDMGLLPADTGTAGIPIPPGAGAVGPAGGAPTGGAAPHLGTGLLPGPKAPYAPTQQQPEQQQTSGRTEGYIPAAAGSTGVAGTSFAAGLLNLGAETINSLIDQAGQAAAMAISMAASAAASGPGAPGAGAAGPAAGAAAQFLIGMATTAAKRGVSYGFQMGSIGIDALTEQLFPFGAPRWLGYDYTGFMPQINMPNVIPGITTGEKAAFAGTQAQGQLAAGQQPGGPVEPGLMSGQQKGLLPPVMKPFDMPVPSAQTPPVPGTGPGAGPTLAPGAAKPSVGPAPAPPKPTSPAPTKPQQTPLDWLKNSGMFGFDQGGWMQPGQAGINLTNRPEPVLTPQQWEAINKNVNIGGGGGFGVHIQNMYAQDAEDAARQIDSRRRLAMMQYAGRP